MKQARLITQPAKPPAAEHQYRSKLNVHRHKGQGSPHNDDRGFAPAKLVTSLH